LREASVTNRLSTIASIGGAQQFARFGIHGDALTITPIALLAHLVSACLQKVDGVR